MLLIATPAEAKTYNYNNTTIVHQVMDDSYHFVYGIAGNQNHSYTISSGSNYIQISPFNTPINAVKFFSGGSSKWWEGYNQINNNFPTGYMGDGKFFTYSDSTDLLTFAIGEDVSPSVKPNVNSKSIQFGGYTYYNLISNKLYSVSVTGVLSAGDGNLIGDGNLGTLIMFINVYTEAARPIVSVSDIKDVKVTISWNPNGNDASTSFTLQRRLNASQTWTDIYTGTANQYTNTNLVPETTYQYRVRVNHIAGADWHAYSYQGGMEYIEVTTTADPAVAAAQEAASQAKAAKEAAEQTVQYSIDAKTAAMAAESKASEAVEEVKALNAAITPIIHSIKGLNGATATQSEIFSIVVSASNASQFRAGVNGLYTAWQESPQISIALPDKGAHTIEVQATRAEGAPTTSGYITVFRL